LDTSRSNCLPTMDRTSFASRVAPSGVPKSALIASARPPLEWITLDQRLGFLGGTTVMNNICAPVSASAQRCGPSNSTGGPRHQCSFVVLSHPYSLSSCPSQHLNLSRCGASGDRRNSVAFIQKPICFKSKHPRDTRTRSMVGVGIEDQLGVRHVLNEIKRIHCVKRLRRDFRSLTSTGCLMFFRYAKRSPGWRAPFADGGNLGWRNLVVIEVSRFSVRER